MSRIIKRYSIAFPQRIVSEIESGKLTIAGTRCLYDIKGSETIQRWMVKLGKNHLLNNVVRIEMKGERDRIQELEKQVRHLESALAHEHIRNLVLESFVDIAGDKYGIDFKKKSGGEPLSRDIDEPKR